MPLALILQSRPNPSLNADVPRACAASTSGPPGTLVR